MPRRPLCFALSSPRSTFRRGARLVNSNSGRPSKGGSQAQAKHIHPPSAWIWRRAAAAAEAAVREKEPPPPIGRWGRVVYKWRPRGAAAASRERQEGRRRRPLLPTGTARGAAPRPRGHPPQVISRVLRSPVLLPRGVSVLLLSGGGSGVSPRRPRVCCARGRGRFGFVPSPL